MSKVCEIGTRVKPSAEHYQKLTELFKAGQMTDEAAGRMTGLSERSVARWRRHCGLSFYVADWAEGERGRKVVPIWRIGKRDNAPRPGPRETAAERMARIRRERKKE